MCIKKRIYMYLFAINICIKHKDLQGCNFLFYLFTITFSFIHFENSYYIRQQQVLQTNNCQRVWRLSASWGPIPDTLKHPAHHRALYRTVGLTGGL